jgi:hypothetical protein
MRMGRAVFGLAVFALFAWPSPAVAADVRGAELTVQRGAGTEDCPDEKVWASELSGRIGLDAAPSPADSADRGPRTSDEMRRDMHLAVTLTRDSDAYVATIRAEGPNPGVRTLKAAGPTCDALHDALGIALLVLLDPHPLSEPEPAVPAPPAVVPPVPTEPPRVEEPLPKPDAAPVAPLAVDRSSRAPSVWISLGGAVTHGLPVQWSGAGFGDLFLEGPADWGFAVGAFFTGEGSVDAPPGEVLVRAYGARLRGCHGVLPTSTAPVELRVCAVGSVALLQAEGSGFSTNDIRFRPFFSIGPLADLAFRWSSRWSLGLQLAALFGPHREEFTIDGVQGVPFRTDAVIGWLGTDLRYRVW